MTEAIKVQARYGLLMQATDKWAGDFANTSDQLANSTRIAQAQFKEAQAELGDALLPVMEDVVNMVRASLIPLLAQLAPVFAQVGGSIGIVLPVRSEEHTSELQSRENLVCRLLLEKKKRQEE